MALRGYRDVRIDDRAFDNYIDRFLNSQMTKLKNAAENSMEKIVFHAIKDWYVDLTNNASPTIAHTFFITTSNVKQKKNFAFYDITANFSETLYRRYTDHYRIYKWAKRHRRIEDNAPLNINVAAFSFSLPWDRGFVGLPSPDFHGVEHTTIKADKPLKEFVEERIIAEWEQTVLGNLE